MFARLIIGVVLVVGLVMMALDVASTIFRIPIPLPEMAMTPMVMKQFSGGHVSPTRPDSHVQYNLAPDRERFFMYVPPGYTGKEAYGLIVFTSPGNSFTTLPPGWAAVLDARKYILIASQNAGNDQSGERRMGLAVLAAAGMMQNYRIDYRRVYAAGLSGGARISGLLGFYQADIFRGTLQICGADFYGPVPLVASPPPTPQQPYGRFSATDEEIAQARHTRFALITGPGDFRHGYIVDIFHGGFEREGFDAALFDVPGMGHAMCSAETLASALDFLER
jgi:hypothetical protein